MCENTTVFKTVFNGFQKPRVKIQRFSRIALCGSQKAPGGSVGGWWVGGTLLVYIHRWGSPISVRMHPAQNGLAVEARRRFTAVRSLYTMGGHMANRDGKRSILGDVLTARLEDGMRTDDAEQEPDELATQGSKPLVVWKLETG